MASQQDIINSSLAAAQRASKPHAQYAAWNAAGRKGASGANAPGGARGTPDIARKPIGQAAGGANPPGRGAGGAGEDVQGRVNQLRQAIGQGKMPPPLTPPTSTNGRVGSAAGGPTPVSGGETAFSGPAAGAGSSPGPSPGLLALAGQVAQAKPGQMTQFQGPPAQQGALSAGSDGGAGGASSIQGLAGMMGSIGPGSMQGAGGSGSSGMGGPLPSTGEGGGGWQAPGGGGGPMPWFGSGSHTNPQPIGTLSGAPGSPFLQRPTVPTTNLGPIGNPPRTNPGAPGAGLHPGLGGFGSSMF